MDRDGLKKVLLGGVAAVAMGAGLLVAPEVTEKAVAQTAPGTYTTQTAAKADAATFYTMVAGGRTTCSTSQDTVANLTITINPPANNYVYLTGIYFEAMPNATAATSTTVWSATNLTDSNGLTPAWITPEIASAAANPTALMYVSEIYPTAMKSKTPGTAVTILPQATTASAFLCAHAVGYFNPY